MACLMCRDEFVAVWFGRCCSSELMWRVSCLVAPPRSFRIYWNTFENFWAELLKPPVALQICSKVSGMWKRCFAKCLTTTAGWSRFSFHQSFREWLKPIWKILLSVSRCSMCIASGTCDGSNSKCDYRYKNRLAVDGSAMCGHCAWVFPSIRRKTM